jgi:hypothetical protein
MRGCDVRQNIENDRNHPFSKHDRPLPFSHLVAFQCRIAAFYFSGGECRRKEDETCAECVSHSVDLR